MSIERVVCYWCSEYATHDTNGVSDGAYPSCDKCCNDCGENGCGYAKSCKCEGYCESSDHERNEFGASSAGLAKLLFR